MNPTCQGEYDKSKLNFEFDILYGGKKRYMRCVNNVLSKII